MAELGSMSAAAYQTQEEFDSKYGANYESYGLHIKKVPNTISNCFRILVQFRSYDSS